MRGAEGTARVLEHLQHLESGALAALVFAIGRLLQAYPHGVGGLRGSATLMLQDGCVWLGIQWRVAAIVGILHAHFRKLLPSAMPRPKPVGETLSEALNYSIRLEERRGSLTPFELKRLEVLAYPKEGNYLQYLVKEMLVAEIERDYSRFDSAADRFLTNGVPGDLLVNMSSVALFSLSPHHVSAMIRRLVTECPDWLDGLMLVQSAALFVGDLGLCKELRERIARLGGEMEQDVRDVQAERILAAAGVEPDSYHGFVQGVYSLVRKHVSGRHNTRLILDVSTQLHEDGHESIVHQVISSLEDEQLDDLDEELLEYASSPEIVDSGVPNVVTVLVRDMPALQAEGAA